MTKTLSVLKIIISTNYININIINEVKQENIK